MALLVAYLIAYKWRILGMLAGCGFALWAVTGMRACHAASDRQRALHWTIAKTTHDSLLVMEGMRADDMLNDDDAQRACRAAFGRAVELRDTVLVVIASNRTCHL